LHGTGPRKRAASGLLLTMALSLLGAELLASFHHHPMAGGPVVDTRSSPAAWAGPCLTCRVSEQKLSIPVTASGARPSPIPAGVAPSTADVPRSHALPPRAPRSPPSPARSVV